MKFGRTSLIAVAALALAVVAWLCLPSGETPPDGEGQVLRSRTRRIRDAGKSAAKRQEWKIRSDKGGKAEQAGKPAAKDKGFDINDDAKLPSGFVDDEEELMAQTSEVVRQIYGQLISSMNAFDRKRVMAEVRKLLAAIAKNGSSVPRCAKLKAIEGIKLCGGGCDALPEMVALASDADPSVASVSLDALQDLLWDFDTNPQQIADALKQVVGLTEDKSIIEPFMFEMNDMPTAMKVDTALAVVDSGNANAIELLDENRTFIFDDFDGSISTREDIVNYGKNKGVETDGESPTVTTDN